MHSFFRWIQRGRKSGRTASWQYQNTFCGAKYCLKKGEKEMGALSNKVHERFENFNFKNYGYNQFSKFISGISGVAVSYTHLTLPTI